MNSCLVVRWILDVVGDQRRWLVAADVAHRELADGSFDVLDVDQLVVDLGLAVAAGALDPHGFPLWVGQRGELCDQFRAAFAQGQPADPALGQLGEHLVGGQLGVEHQQAGILAGDVLPVVGERDDLAGLLGLGQVGVGVHHLGGGVVLGEERQHRAGALRAARHVVLLGRGVGAVVVDRVEVEVESLSSGREAELPEPAGEPGQELLVTRPAHAVGVAGQVR